MSAAAIVRIVAVRDTRAREEVGDRLVPIPGSGNIRPCDRCARDHEIHVDVELADGRSAVIGQGCARGESMEVQARIKSAISAAKTRAKLAAELAGARAKLEASEAVWAAVQALPLPGDPVLSAEWEGAGGPMREFTLGDARVWVYPECDPATVTRRVGGLNAERRATLERSWRAERYREAGQAAEPWWHRQRVRDLAERLERAERKLASILG